MSALAVSFIKRIAATSRPAEVKRAPLAEIRSTISPAINEMPVMTLLRPAQIMVDRSYRRGLVVSNAKKIAKNWDWNLAGVISVGQRPDGSYWIYDGQTRTAAAALRGDIPFLNCTVIQSTGPAMEAKAFLQQNRDRVAIKGVDYHNAAIVALDPVAVKIGEILAEYGIEIVHSRASAGKTTGIMNIRNQFARLNDPLDAERRLRLTLNVIKAAWATDDRAYSGQFIRGVWRFVSGVSNTALLLEKAEERLGHHSVEDLLYKAHAQAKAQDVHMSVTIPKVLLEQFNFRKSKHKLA